MLLLTMLWVAITTVILIIVVSVDKPKLQRVVSDPYRPITGE